MFRFIPFCFRFSTVAAGRNGDARTVGRSSDVNFLLTGTVHVHLNFLRSFYDRISGMILQRCSNGRNDRSTIVKLLQNGNFIMTDTVHVCEVCAGVQGMIEHTSRRSSDLLCGEKIVCLMDSVQYTLLIMVRVFPTDHCSCTFSFVLALSDFFISLYA